MNSNYLHINNSHLFIWLAIMFILSLGGQTQYEEENENIIIDNRYSLGLAVLIFLPILLMSVWGPPRSDTGLYLRIFHTLPSNFNEGLNEVSLSDCPGFTMLGVMVKNLFGSNDTPYRLTIGLIHAIPLMTILREYSDNYLFSVYMFVASSMHLSWMMNGLRQFIAVTIIFFATPWIVEKKYPQLLLVILFAASFHKTALFMIPIIFIVQGDIWNWKTLLMGGVLTIVALISLRNINAFEEFADVVGYSTEYARSMGDNGVHPLRVLVSAIPMILAFISRRELREENNDIINICVNMSVITTGVGLIGIVTSGIMVGRMMIYTSLYNLILLPHVINTSFEGDNAVVIKIFAVMLYFIFFYVQRGL